MPELPEVDVVRAGLAPAVVGATVVDVAVHDERALTRHHGDAADFAARLNRRVITGVERLGKFLWMPLGGSAQALVAHLGMSGQLLLRKADAPPERHERIRLDIQHPTRGSFAVVFADQRTFGSLAVDALLPDETSSAAVQALLPSQVRHIARDLMDPLFDDALFVAAVQRRGSAIKRILLDQTVVSGIGNIYADEALWAAGLHPETLGRRLSGRSIDRLLAEARSVLERALAEGGTSFDAQYVNVNGQAGYFAHSLNAYGRHGQPCRRCGTLVVRESFMNRGSHFCPKCQKVR